MKTEEYIRGFQEAEKDFYAGKDFANPFPENSNSWKGYEDAVYIFTQK